MPGGSDIGSGLGGAIGGAIGYALAGQGGTKQYKKALQIWEKLKTSDFDMRELSPPEIQVFAQAFPEVYDAVIKGQPELPQDSAEGRGAQLQGLRTFEDVAREGLPTAERMAADEAMRQSQATSRSIEDSVLQDLAQRGRLGAGDEIAARMAGAGVAQNQAAQSGADMARMRVANRLSGAEQAAALGGQIRGQDVAVSQARADAMNRFNELASQLGTQAAQQNAAARERAQAYNVGTAQHVGEENVQSRHQTELENLTRRNALKNQLFGQQVTKAGGTTQALYGLGNLEEAKRLERIKLGQSVGQGVGGAVGGFAGGY